MSVPQSRDEELAGQPKGTSPSGLRGPKDFYRRLRREQRFKNLIWTSSFFLLRQNHSGDAVLENRLMKVDPESFRGFATAFGRVLASLGKWWCA
jgi:hypothetical protein